MFSICAEASILISCSRQWVELKCLATLDSAAFSSCCCTTAALNYEPNQNFMLLFLGLRSLSCFIYVFHGRQCLTGVHSSELFYMFCFLSPWWGNCWRAVHCHLALTRSETHPVSRMEQRTWAWSHQHCVLSFMFQNPILLCFHIIKRALFVTESHKSPIYITTVSLAAAWSYVGEEKSSESTQWPCILLTCISAKVS